MMNTAAVYRKTLMAGASQAVIDIPEEFRGRSVEIIVLPVPEGAMPEQTPRQSKASSPMFTKAQIEVWANALEIQALSGALKSAGLPDDVDARKIREMRLAEKYGA